MCSRVGMQRQPSLNSSGAIGRETTPDTCGGAASAERRSLSILLVDDDEAWCATLALGLELAGHHVTACNAAEDALEVYRRAPADIDLVITDFWMPRRNGLELAFDLRGVRPVPMLLMSGYCAEWTPAWIKFVGVQEFLRKPLTIAEIVTAIDRVCFLDSPRS